MTTQVVKLVDTSGAVVACAQVGERDGLFTGSIDLGPMPAPMRQQFEEFEGIINGQSFSLLDEVEDRVDRLGLKVVFEGGREAAVEDLQIYPGGRRISFRLPGPKVQETTPAAEGQPKPANGPPERRRGTL